MDSNARDGRGYRRVSVVIMSDDRWTLNQAWVDEDSAYLGVALRHPDDDALVKEFLINLPISADGDDLKVGEPTWWPV